MGAKGSSCVVQVGLELAILLCQFLSTGVDTDRLAYKVPASQNN